jgi:transcriptional regulator with XRE-family HTH domain
MQGSQIQEILAKNIKRVRKEMSFTQAQLAERASISTGYMCDIERSRRWPSADNLAKIAAVLKMDPFQLFLPTEDSPYFDRHRTLTAFNRQLQETFKESAADVFEKMLKPYGPMRLIESIPEDNDEPGD